MRSDGKNLLAVGLRHEVVFMLPQENDEPHILISLFSLEYLGKENIRLLYFVFASG
jgi:hypothetical protein